MAAESSVDRYDLAEEIASSIIHGLGVVLAVAGLAVLTTFASLHGSARHVVGCSIFGSTLILLYLASTLYHSIPQPRARAVFRALDHSAIFLLIAGTYTPFTLVNLSGPWGWSLLGVVWALAILGIVLRVTLRRRPAAVFVALYLGMGWCVIVAVNPLLKSVAPGGLLLLVSGGLVYTVGLAFYGWRRLRFHHAIWHGFVLVGSILHYFAILFYVIPWHAFRR